MDTKIAPQKFIEKIKAKMKEQNLGIRELARKLGVSHPTVTELVTYGKKPSFDTSLALAEWLEQSPVAILREAELLPPGPPDDVTFDDWKDVLSRLSERDQTVLKQTALSMLDADKKNKETSAARLKTSPSKP